MQERWLRSGSPGVVIPSPGPQELWRSALKEMQGRISTEKAELSLPRADERDVIKSLDSGDMAPSSDTAVEGIQVSCWKEMSPHLEFYPGFKGQVHFCGYRCRGDGI